MSDRRYGNATKDFPRQYDGAGQPLCAWCKKPLSGRRTKYCSEACRDEVYVRTMPSFARGMVNRRDRGVCSQCGCDTEKIERVLRWADKLSTNLSTPDEIRRSASYWVVPHGRGGRRWWKAQIKHDMGFVTDHLWEMDHITPVVEGGGMCGLDGLRTLCVPCHREETAALAKRRAIERKKPLPLFEKATP